MVTAWRKWRFIIEGFTPDSVPMLRLCQYMTDLARLLGESDHVRFGSVGAGSTTIEHRIESVAEQTVRERLLSLKKDDSPADARKAFRAMNRRLADDQATGTLQDEKGSDVMRFDGQEAERPSTIGPVREAGTLDGVLIRIGGKGSTVPVHLMDGSTLHKCTASRETAQDTGGSSLPHDLARGGQRRLGVYR